MTGEEFSLQFPLFALKRESGYVAYNLGATGVSGPGFGIPVFTNPGNVGQFLGHTATEARVVSFDRVGVFRHFLRPLRDQGTVILFDLLPDRYGNLRSEHAYPAAVVLERLLPEPGFGWGYPVYVLKYRHGFACVQAEHDGVSGKWLVVFTDADLADRAVAAALEHLEAVPVADRQALAHLVRGLSADIGGAVFDPPDPRRGGRPAAAFLRQQLLANLELEI